MRPRSRWLVAGLLLAATTAGAAPPSTPTRTQTWTPKATATDTVPPATPTATRTAPPTITGTLLPSVRIPPELIQWVTPAPTPVASPRCVYVLRSDVLLPECVPLDMVGGGGGCLTEQGATRCPKAWSEDVSTSPAASYVDTTTPLPAGSIVERCFARTLATLNTSTSAGVSVGTDGADHLWGTVTGAVGSTNTADTHWPSRFAIYTDTAVRVSAKGGGTFTDNTGVVRIVCFYVQLGGIP